MTQRRNAEWWLDQLPPINQRDLKNLREILGEAQNGPPLGAADGSIDEEAWYALRDIVEAYETIEKSRTAFRRIR